jgi:MGT family glycosyltransferase
MDVVIVTWQAGGVTQPAIGLGRRLVERGHRARLLGPAALEARVRVAGLEFRPWPAALEFDASLGRAFEDQWPHVHETMLMGPGLPVALAAEVGSDRPDAVVVDFFLRSTLFEAERLGLPAIPLLHMPYRYFAVPEPDEDPDAEWGWRWTYRRLNELRSRMGLPPIEAEPADAMPTASIAARAPATLVVMPPEFDPWPSTPSSVKHVGAVFEEAIGDDGLPVRSAWDAPWRADDTRPLVVVSLGTTYMHHEGLIAWLARVVAGVGARVLVLTGHALAPSDLPDLPSGVEVRSFVPHSAVLPEADLLVTHAGMGSLMAAYAAGVPTVCVPIGRDQGTNAELALERGASLSVGLDASDEAIATAVRTALDSTEMRAAARRMQAVIAADRGGAAAVDVLQAVVGRRGG